MAEDGYLTLRFRTRWGDDKPHVVNLVADDPANPYEMTFHHKGNTSGPVSDGIVAFKLDRLSRNMIDGIYLIELKWNSFSGAKSVTFKYCTGKASGTPSAALQSLRPTANVK